MIYRDPDDREPSEPSWPFIWVMIILFATPFIAVGAIVLSVWFVAH